MTILGYYSFGSLWQNLWTFLLKLMESTEIFNVCFSFLGEGWIFACYLLESASWKRLWLQKLKIYALKRAISVKISRTFQFKNESVYNHTIILNLLPPQPPSPKNHSRKWKNSLICSQFLQQQRANSLVNCQNHK